MKKAATLRAAITPGPYECEGGWIFAQREHGVGGQSCMVAQILSGPDCPPIEMALCNGAAFAALPELLALAERVAAIDTSMPRLYAMATAALEKIAKGAE
jgi:hypothetical protein